MRKNPSIRLINLGCSKNQVDSENILRDFHNQGIEPSQNLDSDIVLINTCGFIEAAKEESIQEILSVTGQKTENQKVVVAGCLSERYLEELKKEIPEVDHFYGVYKPKEIARDLKQLFPETPTPQYVEETRIFLDQKPHHAYVKIAEGCNRICGFCAIPLMRGKQNSRSITDVVKEVQQLQNRGIMEVSLVAQDLTFYGRENKSGENLEGLLKSLIGETDVPWFRLMYGYPAYLTDGLLEFMGSQQRICNYMDMPIQHVSDNMLKSMRRGYSKKSLRELIANMRKHIPNLSLRTTVLVGYPGEKEEDVEELLDFMEETRFNRLGGFIYSDEDNTHAETLENKIEDDIKQDRLDRVMALQQDISLDHNQNLIGKKLKVLIDEEISDDSEFDFVGRTEFDAPEIDNTVYIKGAQATPGTFRQVEITEGLEFDLEAELLPE